MVELDALSEPSLVLQAVVSTLGLRELPDQALLETLATHLRSRQLILLLDNCEHLLDACAWLARTLLATCPDLCILATSREPLHIGGEVVWPVPPLSLPDAQRDPTPRDILRSEAVQLFVDRARRVSPSFNVTPQNASAVAQICSRLDGLPLAIELAAVWVNALSVAQIAGRLHNRFRLLIGGERTAPHRHQTLEATLDWSYGLLPEPEQLLFQRLAVFAGAFDLQAAEAVCSDQGLDRDGILPLLSHLVGKSLVMVARESGPARRYRLLETVRQYACSRSGALHDGSTVSDRHLSCAHLH